MAFDPETATKAYLATLAAAARAKSDAYFEGGYWFIVWNFLAGTAALLFLYITGISAALRRWAAARVPSFFLKTVLFSTLLLAILSILTLPLAYYQDFVREHDFGLSTQTLAAWLQDWAIGASVGAVLPSLFVPLLYRAIKAWPRNWALAATAIMGLFFVIAGVLGPVIIEPLFNKITPMQESPLKAGILSLARANGIPADNVYVFDTSRQSTRVTAHVSGLLGTTRVTLGDNLLKQGPAVVRAVMGHEMGHYVLGHAWTLIAWQLLGALVGFTFISGIYNAALALPRFGVEGPGDPAGLPLLLLIGSLFGLLVTPLSNTLTRTIETQADYFGLNAAAEPDGFAKAALALSTYRKLEPTALEEFVFFDHPSGYNRIHRAMIWKGEHLPPADPASQSGTPATP